MSMEEKIRAFFAGRRFAVVGASRDRAKYGNKVLRAYQQNNLDVPGQSQCRRGGGAASLFGFDVATRFR